MSTDNFDSFYTKTEDAKEQLKKEQLRNTLIIIGIVLVVVGGLLFQKWQENANLDYIDGNVLKVPRTGSASTGNPWKNDSLPAYLAFASIFETDSTFTEVNPLLADSYDVSGDGLIYNIYFKEDLKWSDGTPMTMEDMVWSIETFLLNSATNLSVTSAFNKIKGVEEWQEVGLESWENGGTHSLEGLSYNGNVLTIELESPHHGLPIALTQFIPLPKHMLEDEDPTTFLNGLQFFNNPVCSGMYMTSHIDEDGDLHFVINPHYCMDEVSDIETIIMYGDYQNTHVGYYNTTNITEMVSYRSMPGFEEIEVDVQFYRYFVFNLMRGGFDQKDPVALLDSDGNEVHDEDGNVIYTWDDTPMEYEEDEERPENTAMQDIRVRQAISLAIDRENFLKDSYLGTGTYDFAEAGSSEYTAFLTDYNPTKARELLLESDYDLSRPLIIGYYHTDDNSKAYLEKVAAALEDIGFEEVVIRYLNGDNLYTYQEYDLYMKAYSTYTNQDWYNEYLIDTGNVHTVTGSTEYDPLLDVLNATMDEASYNAAMSELQKIDQELMYKLPLYSLNEMVYINGNRVSVPDDLALCSVRYRCDYRLSEWYIKKA